MDSSLLESQYLFSFLFTRLRILHSAIQCFRQLGASVAMYAVPSFPFSFFLPHFNLELDSIFNSWVQRSFRSKDYNRCISFSLLFVPFFCCTGLLSVHSVTRDASITLSSVFQWYPFPGLFSIMLLLFLTTLSTFLSSLFLFLDSTFSMFLKFYN